MIEKCPADKYYQTYIIKKDLPSKLLKIYSFEMIIKIAIMKKIIASKLIDKKEYKYSDFTFIILKEICRKIDWKIIRCYWRTENSLKL
jgi:beta-N-acetylhexosaminidase